jgi:hypothetical protein
MLQRLLVLLLPAVILLFPVFPTALLAQAAADQAYVPPFQAYGGVSYFFRSYDSTHQTPIRGGMGGWDASLRAPVPWFNSWLGVTGDASGVYRSDARLDLYPRAYFFVAGPQVSIATGRSMIFAHGMAGVGLLNNAALPSLTSNASFALDLGAGYDYAFRPGWAWRISLDYMNSHFHSADSAVQDLANSNGRITTGPVFRF